MALLLLALQVAVRNFNFARKSVPMHVDEICGMIMNIRSVSGLVNRRVEECSERIDDEHTPYAYRLAKRSGPFMRTE